MPPRPRSLALPPSPSLSLCCVLCLSLLPPFLWLNDTLAALQDSLELLASACYRCSKEANNDVNPIACSPSLPIADRRSEIRSRNEAWCGGGGDKKGLGRFIGRPTGRARGRPSVRARRGRGRNETFDGGVTP